MRMRGSGTRAFALMLSCVGAVAAAPRLEWQRLPDLPDAVGRKGMYAGASAGHVILAGGSNFPVPQSEGGTKRFHRDIWVRADDAAPGDAWRKVPTELPETWGEGASVTTVHGVVGVGGNNGQGEIAEVFLLRYDGAKRDVEHRPLPRLPAKLALAAADECDGWIYVAGGMGSGGARAELWRLPLEAALAEPGKAAWEKLPSLPVPARYGAFLVTVRTAEGPRLVLGGGIAGPARSQLDYLRDFAGFDVGPRRWRRGPEMPRGAVGASALALTGGRLLVAGGSDGHDFARMRELGERYRLPDEVLMYDAGADAWATVGRMPVGVTGAAVVPVPGGWVVAGGEPTPGRRTAQVHRLTVRDEAGGVR